MKLVTSGYLQRLFFRHDEGTILRRPNIRRFAEQHNIYYEIHEKAWLIDYEAFMKAIAPKEYPWQSDMDRIRKIDDAIKLYNENHIEEVDTDTIEKCLTSGKIFHYRYWDQVIVNYAELACELFLYFRRKKPKK